MLYHARQKKIDTTDYLQYLSHEAGNAYSACLVYFWRIWRKKGVWLSKPSMQKLIRNTNLHSQTVQGIIDKFYEAVESCRETKKSNSHARMPKRRKWYFVIPYKSSAIRFKDGQLILSNGKGNEPTVMKWIYKLPKVVSISFDKGYRINATYTDEPQDPVVGYDTAGVDLGEIHLAAAHTQDKTIIANGRVLRSKRRYQNKVKAHFQRKMSGCKKRSRRWNTLNKAKNRVLSKLDNQIKDILHKQTTKLVFALKKEGVKTVAIGDVRNLRQNVDYGRLANQKIHQMPAGQTRFMLTYKAKRLGMEVHIVNEAYSSQTCPKCLKKHKPGNREYKCPYCGFVFHRDGVGAINIRHKQMYKEYVPVVGDMTPPVGIRYAA
jgi:putative transposase